MKRPAFPSLRRPHPMLLRRSPPMSLRGAKRRSNLGHMQARTRQHRHVHRGPPHVRSVRIKIESQRTGIARVPGTPEIRVSLVLAEPKPRGCFVAASGHAMFICVEPFLVATPDHFKSTRTGHDRAQQRKGLTETNADAPVASASSTGQLATVAALAKSAWLAVILNFSSADAACRPDPWRLLERSGTQPAFPPAVHPP